MFANSWIPDETPILESVFLTLAADACDISGIAAEGLPSWYFAPLSYAELADWAGELLTG